MEMNRNATAALLQINILEKCIPESRYSRRRRPPLQEGVGAFLQQLPVKLSFLFTTQRATSIAGRLVVGPF